MQKINICFEVCTTCTLNCRACSFSIPMFKALGVHYYVSPEKFRKEITVLFNIYDHVQSISLVGGEPLLHSKLAELIEISAQYSDKYDQLHIVTNGTIMPDKKLLQAMQMYPKEKLEIQISDYGKLSDKVQAIAEILKENRIPYRIKAYHGTNQYCGGWVDYGPLDVPRGYSEKEATNLFKHCRMSYDQYLSVLDGKLTLCCHTAAGFYMNCFNLNLDEYVDLLGDEQTLDEKKKIVSGFGKKPIQACFYCNGFDPQNSLRVPGAEQV